MKLRKSLLAVGCALFGATTLAPLPLAAQEKKPNIVFILVDNVGWGDFGVDGGTVPTPRIDELAREGVDSTAKRNASSKPDFDVPAKL